MSQVAERIAYFRQKQSEIVKLHSETEPKRLGLVKEFEDKVESLKAEYNDKVNEVTRALDNEKEKYKAELKAFAGVTDGETTNILDVVELVARIGGQA